MPPDGQTGDRNDTAAVFARVTERLQNDDAARSLWRKLQEEIKTGGTSSAVSYLRSRFTALSTRIEESLTSVTPK
jgi:hypothetical protein